MKLKFYEAPVVLDTNIFIDVPDILERCEKVIIPLTVLKELDGLKNKPDVGYSVRTAIRNIHKAIVQKRDIVFDNTHDASIDNDLNIIFCSRRYNCELLTKDVSMSFLAKAYGVDCTFVDEDDWVHEYNPLIVDETPEFPFGRVELEGEHLEAFQQYIREKFNRELSPWAFYHTPTNHGVWCYNPKKNKLETVTGNPAYKTVEVEDGVTFTPKDMYQKMGVYSILNSDATLLLGKYGSGKSLIACATAIALAKGRKVFVLRPTTKSSKYDIGFLPGDKNEKLYEFFSGFLSSLAFLYGNTRTVTGGASKNNCSYDYVKEEVSKQKFEYLTMSELHGLSIQSGDIVLVDEVQLINKSYMQLLLSRICDGAKLVMMGDTSQMYGLLSRAESGLHALIENLPHRGVNVVELKKTYRNKELVEIADKITQ